MPRAAYPRAARRVCLATTLKTENLRRARFPVIFCRTGVDARTAVAPEEISLTPYGGLIKENTMGDAHTGVAPQQFRLTPYGAQPRTVNVETNYIANK